MSDYSHILIGLDLSEESHLVLNKVKLLAPSEHTVITACHIVEPIGFAYGGDIPIDLSEAQKTLEQQATKKLDELVSQSELNVREQIIQVGQASSELHYLAEKLDADLIVVGSHGRHGLALLLGSTANGVLHGAKCDVLAVRV